MKKKDYNSTTLALWVLIIIMLVIISAIVVLNIKMQRASDIKWLLLDLLNSLLSAVTVGLIASTFAQIIANNMIRVKRNNEKLSKFGVEYIGTGRSSPIDTDQLFGNGITKNYPSEIKLLFISGDGYFRAFGKNLLHCVQNSDCVVKILLLSVDPSNREFISRMEKMCPQKISYYDQVMQETLPILQSVVDNLDESKKKQVRLRFYKDEYRYNFRIAKFFSEDNVEGKCWLNIQPFNRDAVDISVGLNGSWDNEHPSDSNIFELLDAGFDQIWDEYKETEYIFN